MSKKTSRTKKLVKGKQAGKILKRFKSQHDESAAARAITYTDEEEERIITGKLQQRIQYQADIRELFLSCVYQQQQVHELIQLHDSYVSSYKLMDGTVIVGSLEMKKDKNGNVLYGMIKDKKTGKEHKADTIKKLINMGINDTDKPRWFGIPMPLNILVAEINLQQHRFKTDTGKLTYMSTELTKLGFSKDQITAVQRKGKYISDIKILDKMEKEYNDKRLQDCEDVIDGTGGNTS